MFTTYFNKKEQKFIHHSIKNMCGFPENYTENAISLELFGIFKNRLRCKKSTP